MPIMNDLLDIIKPVVEKVTEWASKHPNVVKGIVLVAGVLATLATAIGILAPLFSGLATAIGLVNVAFGFLAANPIILVIM